MIQKALPYATMHRLKSIIFFTNWHCYLILMSYLSGIYLESWFLWLGGGLQKTLKKTEENKHFGHRTL